jgi:hypothetical protein
MSPSVQTCVPLSQVPFRKQSPDAHWLVLLQERPEAKPHLPVRASHVVPGFVGSQLAFAQHWLIPARQTPAVHSTVWMHDWPNGFFAAQLTPVS